MEKRENDGALLLVVGGTVNYVPQCKSFVYFKICHSVNILFVLIYNFWLRRWNFSAFFARDELCTAIFVLIYYALCIEYYFMVCLRYGHQLPCHATRGTKLFSILDKCLCVCVRACASGGACGRAGVRACVRA